jgi:hypothetical protein
MHPAWTFSHSCSGADGERVAKLDRVERRQEQSEHARRCAPAAHGDGLAGVGAAGPGELAAVVYQPVA